jgi:CzcA family heavy metal efflux pump
VIALVFIPLFFLDGVEGRLLQPLGIAYLVALLASLIVALTVTPVLCSFLLPGSRAVQSDSETRWVRWLKHRYDPLLCRALDRPWSIGGPTLLALVLALLATPFMGRAFLPDFNEGSLTITAVTLPGTSLPESDALGRAVERALLDLPHVASVARRTGRAELDEHVQEVSSSEIEVALHPDIPDRTAFLGHLRASLNTVPGLVYSVGQPISHRIDHLLSGTRASIAIKIFGPELAPLRRLGQQVHDAIEDLPGVVDLAVDPQTEVPLLTVAFDRAALARHGVSVQSVSQTLQAALRGLPVSRVLEPGNAVDLVLRWDAPEASHIDTLRHLNIPTSSGSPVPLESLARVQRNLGPNQIAREQVERKIVVQCNVAGRDVTSVVHDMMPLVRQVLEDHPGYRVEFGGQFESATAARRILIWVGLGTLAGIGLLLHLAFGSARDATLVLLNLPLALIGGVLGVFLGGGLLSVASIIGFITVFGVATRNGIMLVSHIRNLQRHEGVTDFRQAVRQGATERLVPILMTALATGLALVPLALAGDQPGNEIQTPMAIVILFGLVSSMILNMLVVPAMFLRYAHPSPPSHP